MSIESGKDLLLALLYVPGRSQREGEAIRGTTRIEKMVFLFKNYQALQPYFRAFEFAANNYGPYSERVQDDLESLRTLRLLEIREIPVEGEFLGDDLLVGNEGSAIPVGSRKILREYRLTRLGEMVARKILADADAPQTRAISEVKEKFNQIPLDELVSFVYTTSDAHYLEKSRIRDRYLS